MVEAEQSLESEDAGNRVASGLWGAEQTFFWRFQQNKTMPFHELW